MISANRGEEGRGKQDDPLLSIFSVVTGLLLLSLLLRDLIFGIPSPALTGEPLGTKWQERGEPGSQGSQEGARATIPSWPSGKKGEVPATRERSMINLILSGMHERLPG